MEKIKYFRACQNKKGFTFQICDGYLIHYYNGRFTIDLVFGKNQYNLWDITELSTGFLAHPSSFLTRREAIAAVTDEHFTVICENMKRWEFYPDAVQRLAEYQAAHPI